VHEVRPSYIGHVPLPAMRFVRQFAGVATQPELRSLNEGIEWLRGEVELRDRRIRELEAATRRQSGPWAPLEERLQ